MTNNAPARAIAVDLRNVSTGALIGVALFDPLRPQAVMLIDGAPGAIAPALPADVWRSIRAWIAASDAALPKRPAPLPASAVAALFDEERAVTADRFASIPIDPKLSAAMRESPERILRHLLDERRSSAA